MSTEVKWACATCAHREGGTCKVGKGIFCAVHNNAGWEPIVESVVTAPTTEVIAASALDVQIAGSHYKKLAIQPIEYITKNSLGFSEGNVVKYITRHQDKGGADDIRKAMHFCKLILELQYGEAP